MIPYFNKNTFYYENYCSYSSWQIPVMDSRGVAEKHRGNTATRYGSGEIFAISVAPRVVGFFIARMPGKVSMKREQTKLPWRKK